MKTDATLGDMGVEQRPALAPPTGPRKLSRHGRGDNLAAAAMITPNALLYLVFTIVPALAGIALSFYQWDFIDTPAFVGLENYRTLLHDTAVWAALLNTGKFLLLGVIPTVLIGFMMASLVNIRMRGIAVIRVLYFVPIVMSSAVASVLWSWLYQPQAGLFNYMLGWVGIDGPAWLVSTTWALPALTLMLIWMSLPLVIILYLAALQRIPSEIIEAAWMDGAGPWKRLWLVIWPNVSSMTILVLALELLHFLAGPFEVALIMTQGGPIDSTTSLSLYIYHLAFERGEVGEASALSILQFLLIVMLAGGLRRVYKYRTATS